MDHCHGSVYLTGRRETTVLLTLVVSLFCLCKFQSILINEMFDLTEIIIHHHKPCNCNAWSTNELTRKDNRAVECCLTLQTEAIRLGCRTVVTLINVVHSQQVLREGATFPVTLPLYIVCYPSL